jgi:transposase, IS5 family
MRAYAQDRDPGDRDADRREPHPHRRRPRLSRPQRPPDRKFKVHISGQRRRVSESIKRELRRRSAVEPVIGHAKAEHRMGRNHLAGTQRDAANAVLAAAGYNFRCLFEWLALLLSMILAALNAATSQKRPIIAA